MSAPNQIDPAWLPIVEFAFEIEADHARHREIDTYKGLYLDMQPMSSAWVNGPWPVIRDWSHPGNSWVNLLPLGDLGTLCRLRGTPCLCCLVRHQDGTVGDGYVTGHYNTHGVQLLRPGHPYRCPCCSFRVNRAARAETQIAWTLGSAGAF